MHVRHGEFGRQRGSWFHWRKNFSVTGCVGCIGHVLWERIMYAVLSFMVKTQHVYDVVLIFQAFAPPLGKLSVPDCKWPKHHMDLVNSPKSSGAQGKWLSNLNGHQHHLGNVSEHRLLNPALVSHPLVLGGVQHCALITKALVMLTLLIRDHIVRSPAPEWCQRRERGSWIQRTHSTQEKEIW